MTNFKFNLDSLKSGRIFSITFEKADGTVKTINARLGVRKHLNGKGMRYVPENYNLMVLWSMTDKGLPIHQYRSYTRSQKSNGVLYSKLT
jgi:hypothetical protein